MKVWSIRFTAPGKVSSARIAAPTPEEACGVLAAAAEIIFDLSRRDLVLITHCGQMPTDHPKLLRVVRGEDGMALEPDAAGVWHEAHQS